MRQFRWNIRPVGRRLTTALRHRYLPDEAYLLGLLDPDTPLEMFDRLASRSELAALQQQLNPAECEETLSDKAVFYEKCLAEGLPVPGFFGVFRSDGVGWTGEGKLLFSVRMWEEFFLHTVNDCFVVKPAQAVYGNGVRIITRTGESFVDHEGTRMSARELVEVLRSDDTYTKFVIQERLTNHPHLVPLSGGGGLLSLRLITLVHKHGQPRILNANLKLIAGDNIVSNNRHGELGNLTAEVDRSTGRIMDTRAQSTDGRGYVPVLCHPDSGAMLDSWMIPWWSRAVELARRAARVFLPVRTVGWDIAITRDGPKLLEGNIWYDPPTHLPLTAAVLAVMRKSVAGWTER